MNDAIYIVEFRSISQGIGALDNMLKRASLALLYANPICIGKYLITVGGDVADAEEARLAAEAPGEERPIASCLLTGTHPAILGYFRKQNAGAIEVPPALGVFETRSAAMGFLSLDAALKAARVDLLRVWLGQLLGGKLCWVLGGSTSDVQSAVKAAVAAVPAKEQAGSRVVISPDPVAMALFVKGGAANEPLGTNL